MTGPDRGVPRNGGTRGAGGADAARPVVDAQTGRPVARVTILVDGVTVAADRRARRVHRTGAAAPARGVDGHRGRLWLREARARRRRRADRGSAPSRSTANLPRSPSSSPSPPRRRAMPTLRSRVAHEVGPGGAVDGAGRRSAALRSRAARRRRQQRSARRVLAARRRLRSDRRLRRRRPHRRVRPRALRQRHDRSVVAVDREPGHHRLRRADARRRRRSRTAG